MHIELYAPLPSRQGSGRREFHKLPQMIRFTIIVSIPQRCYPRVPPKGGDTSKQKTNIFVDMILYGFIVILYRFYMETGNGNGRGLEPSRHGRRRVRATTSAACARALHVRRVTVRDVGGGVPDAGRGHDPAGSVRARQYSSVPIAMRPCRGCLAARTQLVASCVHTRKHTHARARAHTRMGVCFVPP